MANRKLGKVGNLRNLGKIIPSFRFYPTTKNSDLKILEKNFRGFRLFRVFGLALDAHEDTLIRFFNTTIERLEKNAVLRKEKANLKSSMQFHFDTVDEKLLEFDTKVSQVYVVNAEDIKALTDHHQNMHVKVKDLEDRSRKNKLRFGGLSQAHGEDLLWSEGKIKKLIKEKLVIEIEHAHKIGKEERDDPSLKRTIIAKFLNYKDKEKVLREYRSCKLWEERLYISEHFSEETVEIRMELSKEAKELRRKGKFAKVKHERLISFNVRQNSSKFDSGNEEQEAA